MTSESIDLLALNGSPSTNSKTHALGALGVELAGAGRVIDLSELDAEGLLGRRSAPDVVAALDEIRSARVVLVVTPVYRATYSGLLKVLFDQFEQNALANVVCILAATGGSTHHFLALDTGLRPLVASLAGISVPTAVYATGEDFGGDGRPGESLRSRLEAAIREATALAEATARA